MTWPTFWVEPTGLCKVHLRRYVVGQNDRDRCSGWRGFHDASMILPATYKLARRLDGNIEAISPEAFWSWLPVGTEVVCVCGYHFQPEDECQVSQHELYTRLGSNEQWELEELPPGALFDAPWLSSMGVGDDGVALVCVLPHNGDARSGFWHVDGPSHNNGTFGPGWERTGTVRAMSPNVNVTPSINNGLEDSPDHYHGWLKWGVLSDPV